MAERITCANCCYLDKTEKVQTGVMYKYGCRSYLAYIGHITGWLSSDNGLKQMGCSEANRIKVGTGFLLNGINCFYCGSIQTKDGKKYLMYNASTYVQNGFYVDVVEQSWFSENIKDIVIKYQTKEQIEALKQTARFYKKRIMEREEKRRKQKL